MANQIDQNPNQFLTQPNQFSPDPNQFSQIANLRVNQFSQIANRHANQFISHPNLHSIPCKPFANRCRTIRNPGQPAPIFSNDGYNSLLSCCRLDDQWRYARASSQDRLPPKCVIQAAARGSGTLPRECPNSEDLIFAGPQNYCSLLLIIQTSMVNQIAEEKTSFNCPK